MGVRFGPRAIVQTLSKNDEIIRKQVKQNWGEIRAVLISLNFYFFNFDLIMKNHIERRKENKFLLNTSNEPESWLGVSI